MPLITVQDVTKIYAHNGIEVKALDHVNLSVVSGDFMALAGPSGSGKSTLLNLIGALDKPTTGRINVGDVEVSTESARELAKLRLHRIGFVFQDYNLLPVLTAIENVEYVMLLQGVSVKERRRRANDALVQVGLDGCQHRRPAQLSGGQQQRVAIARALAANPLLILADEPTANLDSDTADALIETMVRLNKEQGTTFVFSTHDDMVMRHANRLVRMKDGHISEAAAHVVS